MVTFNMIKQANRHIVDAKAAASTVIENLQTLAESHNQEGQVLAENVTHVLANIAQTAQNGEEIKLMHLNSVAAFLAGVDLLATKLPDSQDAAKKANTLRVLAAVGIDPDGHVTYATTPIAQLGARNANVLQKYQKIVNDYAQSQSRGEPNGRELVQATRKLQMNIDRAMRMAAGTGGQESNAERRGETTFSANKAAAQPGIM